MLSYLYDSEPGNSSQLHHLIFSRLSDSPISRYRQYDSGFLRGLTLTYRSRLRGRFRSYNSSMGRFSKSGFATRRHGWVDGMSQRIILKPV
jgi:hypothetical protein